MSIVLRKAPKTNGYYSIPDLPDFRLRCTLPMTVEVSYKKSNSLKKIFAGSYVPDADYGVIISFKDVLQDLFAPSTPMFHIGYITQSDFAKEIHIKFKDAESEIERTFYILNINASSPSDILDVVSKKFLTLQPDVKETTVDSPEFLTYLYSGNAKRLVVKFYGLTDTSTEVVTLYSWKGGDEVKAVTHNVSYRMVMSNSNTSSSEKKPFYDIYIVDETNQRISIIQRYVFKESTGRENYYLFYNSFGGLDTFITTGDIIQEPSITFDIARTSSGLIQLDNTEDHISYNQKSGYFSIDNINVATDFLLSKKDKYIFNPNDVSCSKIVITDSDVSFNKKESFTAFSFSYRKMQDIPEIEDVVLETQQLIIENNQARTMPLEMPKRDIVLIDVNGVYATEAIECTMDSLLLSIELDGIIQINTSKDAENWELKEEILVDGETVFALDNLEIGSYLKIESKEPIKYIDASFVNTHTYSMPWLNEENWNNKITW